MNTEEITKLAQSAREQTVRVLNQLKQMPRFGKVCICNDGPIYYTITYDEGKVQKVCLRCAGKTSGSGAFYKCPKCNSDYMSTGEWKKDGDKAFSKIECDDCDFGWNEMYQNAEWSL